MAEFAFIAWLRGYLQETARKSPLVVGPGDDTAVLAATDAQRLYAADMLMDGVHFDLRQTAPQLIGRKALAVNLSDIAAMAGRPEAVTVCLALPRHGGTALARGLMQGMQELAVQHGVVIAGGDTNAWDGPLVISVAITGTAHPRGSVLRSGAKVGDWIIVTGALGGSLAGKHLHFTPRLDAATKLHTRYGLHAMLDLSDGLAGDLRHILTASGVGARLDAGALPLSRMLQQRVAARQLTSAEAVHHALTDGEDFELCFTLGAEAGAALLAAWPREDPLPLTKIGEITAGSALTWQDGAAVPVGGWVHALD